MKLLLLFLFTVNANAAFIPIVSAPTAGNACADNEILVYDSTEAAGFRCEAEPSGGGGGAADLQDVALSNTLTSSGTVTAVTFSPITVGEGKVVRISHRVSPRANIHTYKSYYADGGECRYELTRDGTFVDVVGWGVDFYGASRSPGMEFIDFPPAGTHTYSLQIIRVSGTTCGFSHHNMRAMLYVL